MPQYTKKECQCNTPVMMLFSFLTVSERSPQFDLYKINFPFFLSKPFEGLSHTSLQNVNMTKWLNTFSKRLVSAAVL